MNDIAVLETIRSDVRAGITRIPEIVEVMSGRPDKALYARYMCNVWRYAQHSAVVIALAGSRCVGRDPGLAEYLMRHANEELGHDQWALDDLEVLGVAEARVREVRPTPSCAAMIAYEYFMAGHDNPVTLFGWLYVLEAMGDDLGGLVAERIGAGLALDQARGVRFLAGHGVADVEHTRDIIDRIRTDVRPADMPEIEYAARVVGTLYVRMFEEIGASREDPTAP